MKRKISKEDEKESRLSELLFNKSKKLAAKLNTESSNEFDFEQKPAWTDEDDEKLGANIECSSKGPYAEKLKQKYETLMGTPSWAKLSKINKERDVENDELLRTVGHLHKKKTDGLPQDYIELKKLTQVNARNRLNEGALIKCTEFHPKISAALIAGDGGRVSLCSIGGDVNKKLHSFRLQGWHINAAHFTPDGSEALISSKAQSSYCVYNLAKAQHTLVELPKVVERAFIFQISNNGKYIATSDGFEEIYILCLVSKELLKVFRHNTKIVSVTFSHDSSQLICYGAAGEITIWDLSTYKALKFFYDHGCVTASCLATSNCGKLLATGSGEGIVNIYQTGSLTTSEPLPFKVISNLTTKITNIKFNATSELLAASSSYNLNAVKLIHIPSYHVFYNFPLQKFNLHRVQTMSFSPNSGYMSLGNNKGCALLYRLKYYKNY